jgi:hypothetical protein
MQRMRPHPPYVGPASLPFKKPEAQPAAWVKVRFRVDGPGEYEIDAGISEEGKPTVRLTRVVAGASGVPIVPAG